MEPHTGSIQFQICPIDYLVLVCSTFISTSNTCRMGSSVRHCSRNVELAWNLQSFGSRGSSSCNSHCDDMVETDAKPDRFCKEPSKFFNPDRQSNSRHTSFFTTNRGEPKRTANRDSGTDCSATNIFRAECVPLRSNAKPISSVTSCKLPESDFTFRSRWKKFSDNISWKRQYVSQTLRPSLHPGFTRVLSNPIGHLLPGVPRSCKNPWADYIGTWDLPNKLPGPRAYVPTARRFDVWDKMRREADELTTTICGMTENGRRNARLEMFGFKVMKPSNLGSMSPAHDDPCKDVISKIPKEEDITINLNVDEVPDQPEVSAEQQATLLPPSVGSSPTARGSARPGSTSGGSPKPCGARSPPTRSPLASRDQARPGSMEKQQRSPPLPPFDDEGLTEEQKELVRRQCDPCPPDTNRTNRISPCDTTNQSNRRRCAAHMAIFHPPKCLSPVCGIPEADQADAITNMFSDDMCRRSPFPRRQDPMVKVCGAQAPSPGQPCEGFAPCLVDAPEDICPIDPCPRMGIDSWCAYQESAKRSPTADKKAPTPPCKMLSPPTVSPKNSRMEREYERICKRRSPPGPLSEDVCSSTERPCIYPDTTLKEIPGAGDLSPCTRSDHGYHCHQRAPDMSIFGQSTRLPVVLPISGDSFFTACIYQRKKSWRHLPGPSTLSFVGSYRGCFILALFNQWADKYVPIYIVQLGNTMSVLCHKGQVFLLQPNWLPLVKLIYHYQGMTLPAVYLNPVMANIQLLGCSHRGVLEHVTVHWIGPLVGACVAVHSNFCSQKKTQVKPCRLSVTFDERPSAEIGQPCRPSFKKRKCELCNTKSRSNSSRPCRCPSAFEENDEGEGEYCCEDVEPSACRPSGCGIKAQVRQTAINGTKQLNYRFDIPPTVCRKGLRLRHNILVTKQPPKFESPPGALFRDDDYSGRDWTAGGVWGRDCSPSPPTSRCASPSLGYQSLPGALFRDDDFSWRDWTAGDVWRRDCCPTCRCESPGCQSPDDRRRTCCRARDRSRSPAATDPERSDIRRCSRKRASVGRRRSRFSYRRSSRDDLLRQSSRHLVLDGRPSTRRSRGRRSSPSKASGSRNPLKRGQSQQSTVISGRSHATSDEYSATPTTSKYSHVGPNSSRADVRHNKSYAKTKSLAKTMPSQMSTADATHRKKSSAPASRPTGGPSHHLECDRSRKTVRKAATG